jgi:DNA polymerase-4
MAYLTETAVINLAEPQVMHIDLNSAFATIEQQANPLLRGKPVGVCSYLSPGGIVLAASYEAKAKGVGTGTPIREAKELCPGMIFLMPDPEKYFYINARLYALLYQYTNDLVPLSIDEFVLDFSTSRNLHHPSLVQVAKEIKRRIRSEIGCWMRVNIGIAPNRFLAKLAASLHKPDGLDVISHQNLREVYGSVGLRDLCGINYRFEARLNANNIFSPLEFLDAPLEQLHRQVFKSVSGYHWYHRLRGWEVDGIEYGRKSFGNDFAIYLATEDRRELSQLMMKLCEKTGRRLRKHGSHARGAQLWLLYEDRSYWHKSEKTRNILYSTQDIYAAMQRLFNKQPHPGPVSKLGVSVFALEPTHPEQLELFETSVTKHRRIAVALDTMNDRYGEFTLIPARMMQMEDQIIKRVPFGASKDLKGQYQRLVSDYGL